VPSNPGLGDALQGAKGVLFLAKDDETFLNGVHEQGLAELEPSNVAVQVGRIFWARRARLPSCRYWRSQVLLRSQGRELVRLWRHHDDLRHRSAGCRGSRLTLLSPPPSELSRLLNSEQMKQDDWYRKDRSVSCCNSVALKPRELSIEHEVFTALMNADLNRVIVLRELTVV
jgi:hypothetical protein